MNWLFHAFYLKEVYKSNFRQCGRMEKQRWEEAEKRKEEGREKIREKMKK